MQAASGQILSVQRVRERRPEQVKNFGIWIRYNSRSGTHNMYKEYRDTTADSAVDSMYGEMAARHRARRSFIHVIRVAEVPSKDVRRVATKQFIDPSIAFPLQRNFRRRAATKAIKPTFTAARPSTHY